MPDPRVEITKEEVLVESADPKIIKINTFEKQKPFKHASSGVINVEEDNSIWSKSSLDFYGDHQARKAAEVLLIILLFIELTDF